MTRITTLSDPEAVARRGAREISAQLATAIEHRGHAHLALSGGNTPRRTYELLAKEMHDFGSVDVWFADERCVPPEDEESNFKLAKDTLLDEVSIPDGQVHRMLCELGPEQAALRYEGELRNRLGGGVLPVLDIIVLGIGPDGHVASLFPGAWTLDADESAVCHGVIDSPKPPPQRVTLSLAMLRAARRCLLLATGASKSDAVSAALRTPDKHVPASLLCRERLTAIVDDRAGPAAPAA